MPPKTEPLQILFNKRTKTFDSLKRIETFVAGVTPSTSLEQITCRLETIEKLLVDFNTIEDNIMCIDSEQDMQVEEFESQFYNCKAKLKRFENERNPVASVDLTNQLNTTMMQVATQQRSFFEAFSNTGLGASDIKLEPLKIKQFTGDYEQFQSFKDLYESAVHSNSKMNDILKFQYLRKSLDGEPYLLIQHINVTAANYKTAWEKILDRYDKKKYVVAKYIKSFLDIPAINNSQDKASVNSNLRTVYNKATGIIHGLEALGPDAQKRDAWLITILLSKLNSETCKLWAEKTLSNDFPSITAFFKFLGDQCDAYETCQVFAKPSTVEISKQSSSKLKVHLANTSHSRSDELSCPLCNENHSLFKCSKYKSMDVPARRTYISENRICFNCLGKGHVAASCNSKFTCHVCRSRHHTSLHLDNKSNSTSNPSTSSNSTHNSNVELEMHNSNSTGKSQGILQSSTTTNVPIATSSNIQKCHMVHSNYEHLLPTAIANVEDIHGNLHPCRILLDSGSMGNIISEKFVRQLQLSRSKANVIVSGIASNTCSRWKTTIHLSSRFDATKQIPIDVCILDRLTTLPNHTFQKPDLPAFSNLDLADPNFNISSPIDVIINAGLVFSILQVGNITDLESSITAQNTIFGWVMAGNVYNNKSNRVQVFNCKNVCFDIDKTLQLFWQTEEVPKSSKLTSMEIKCEEIYASTVRRNASGRYIVTLPLDNIQAQLGNSLNAAKSRLLAIERKLEANPLIKEDYHSFMSQYLSLGHMERIPDREVTIEKEHCYLPHHFVLKMDSLSTKLRVVFDGSCKTTSGISLNNKLLVGPKTQDDLQTIILRFRTHNIVFCADIEKMYRQILVEPEQRNYQRIVWRDNPTSEIEHFRLTTVTYGTASAPFLATKTLKQLSDDGKHTHPIASPIIASDFYVDDLLTGAQTVDDAITLKEEIVALLSSGGFELRKFASNSKEFLNCIADEHKSSSISIPTDHSSSVKVLGIHWHPENDCFKYKVQLEQGSILTKRQFLSEASKIFDPFGWLSPIIISIKNLFQGLWLLNLSWDDKLPQNITTQWNNIKNNLKCVERIEIPRRIFSEGIQIEFHGFCDASEVAYAAVIYCRDVNSNGNIQTRIITAKTKVAPVKRLSVPKLELCGALLLSRLFHQTLKSLNMANHKIFAWTDSTIVLAWLSDHPIKWQNYVANRTSEILNTITRSCWHHVSSLDNPADCASRGLDPDLLNNFQLWWHGPSWLQHDRQFWPNTQNEFITDAERKSTKIVIHKATLQTRESDVLNQFFYATSSYNKVIQYVSIWRRYIHNLKHPTSRLYGTLTARERRASLKICARASQSDSFEEEMNELRLRKCLGRNSPLSSLCPFIDSEGILRVGGRLQNASCSYETKHPIILRSSHILSKLIVSHFHKFFLHASPSLLSCLIKNDFWIVGGQVLINQETRKCIACIRQRSVTSTQLMGTLPQPRVTIQRAFTHTGIDFAGPIFLSPTNTPTI